MFENDEDRYVNLSDVIKYVGSLDDAEDYSIHIDIRRMLQEGAINIDSIIVIPDRLEVSSGMWPFSTTKKYDLTKRHFVIYAEESHTEIRFAGDWHKSGCTRIILCGVHAFQHTDIDIGNNDDVNIQIFYQDQASAKIFSTAHNGKLTCTLFGNTEVTFSSTKTEKLIWQVFNTNNTIDIKDSDIKTLSVHSLDKETVGVGVAVSLKSNSGLLGRYEHAKIQSPTIVPSK